jgi:hypothetical protein
MNDEQIKIWKVFMDSKVLSLETLKKTTKTTLNKTTKTFRLASIPAQIQTGLSLI